MTMTKRAAPLLVLAAVVAMIAALGAAPRGADAADHLDAPGLMSPGNIGELDINDVYAFEGRSGYTTLAMTVAPAASADSTFKGGFRNNYSLRIDTNGDAIEDITYNFRFFGDVFGEQIMLTQRAKGPKADNLAPKGSVRGVGLTSRNNSLKGGGQVFGGLRSDPFFFDLSGFLGTVEGIGEDALGNNPTDFFDGLNTLAIVIEVPDAELGDGPIGVWATTSRRMQGKYRQIDRMGRPAINTVVNSSGPIVGAPSDAKNVYNAGLPKNDAADFTGAVVDALQAFSSLDAEGMYMNEEAAALAGVLLPDVLAYDKTGTLPPPLNGRSLADDVIDTELRIVTGGDPLGLFAGRDADGAINADGVGPHDDYMDHFPYLGVPHPAS